MDEKVMKDAQYRKGLSIGFFNSTNSAIALVAASITDDERNSDGLTDEMLIDRVRKYRNVFIEDHKNYYATVIANVGGNYEAQDTIKKINSATSMDNLIFIWRSLSEDERRDGEIIKATKLMKTKYEKS